MKASKKYECVLIISDLHIPYHHPESFDFLKAIKKKYKDIDLVVNIGDELDQHALSFHDTDPDLPSAGDELQISRNYIKELEKMFPKMVLLHSNHSSLIYRRALKHGMPKAYLKSYNDFLDVGPGWEWVDDLNIKLSNGQECFMTHGISADGLKLAMQYGKHVIQGHFHSKFNIQYFSNPTNLVWSAQFGCLTKQSSYNFLYSKNHRLRFVIGTGSIIGGQPRLHPMILDKNGKWIGKLV
jgi:hypothetical protein